jgi:hypothetical protein
MLKASSYCRVTIIALLLLVAASLQPIQASAEVLVYEGFDYSPGGSLNGLGEDGFRWGTNRWSQGYAPSDWNVFASGLQFATLPVTGGGIRETNLTQGADYQRLFAPYYLADGQSLWFSFLIRVTQGSQWSVLLSAGQNADKFGVEGNYVDYLLHARIGVGDNGSTNTFSLGQNQVRLIVGRYVYHAGTNEKLDVWLDPSTSTEPISGGLSTTNHIVYSKELTTDANLRDRLLISDRSIGALELDEFRIGTTWADVVSRALDTPVIKSMVLDNTTVHLGVERLTTGTTNDVESATTLTGQPNWEVLSTFVSTASTTNLSLPGTATNSPLFIRLRSH